MHTAEGPDTRRGGCDLERNPHTGHRLASAGQTPRISAMKRQFALDDDYLDDLKAELIEARRVALDEAGQVLV